MLYAPRARASAREQPPKIFLPKRKAKGGVGEVAKKMKENFGVAFALPYLRKLFTNPLSGCGVCSELSSVWWQPEALAYTEPVVILYTLNPPAPPHSSLAS